MNFVKSAFSPLEKVFTAVAIFALVLSLVYGAFTPAYATETPENQPVVQDDEQTVDDETGDEEGDEGEGEEEGEEDGDGPGINSFMFTPCGPDSRCYEPEEDITIVAHKIVCTDEADLPNWGPGAPGTIDGDTAADWVADHNSCSFASDWDFEWVVDSEKTDPGDTLVGPAGDDWTTFGSTDGNGMTTLTLDGDDFEHKKVWFREVLKDGYIPFTHESNPDNSNNVTAEFYCHNDGLNYDNLEWINNLDSGETYHCVAWNVRDVSYEDITMCKKDVAGAPIEGWGMTLEGDDETYVLETGKDGCVTKEVVVEDGPWVATEEDREGWGLDHVEMTDNGRPYYDDNENQIGCEFFGRKIYVAQDTQSVVIDEPEYTCTFVNEEDGVQNTCFVPATNEADEEFEVGTNPPSEKSLTTILSENGYGSVNVNDDEKDTQKWNIPDANTDTVNFVVTILGKQAGNIQEFGYYKAGDTSTFTSVFTIPPTAVGTSFSVEIPTTFANSVGFAMKTTGTQPNTWYSEYELNVDDKDRVAVYNPEANAYIVAFEDLASGDNDYNDLVVEISKVVCEEKPGEDACVANNLLVNGSFEEDEVVNASLWQKFASPLGWLVKKVSDAAATTLELHKGWSGNDAADGLQYAELDGDQPTRVSQDVATEAGATYELRWAFAPRQDTGAAENNLGVEVEGVQVDSEGPMAGIGVLDVEDWIGGTYQFVAGDASTEIAFKDLGPESIDGGSDVGTFLDNAVLCKVKEAPEPEPMCELTIVSDTTNTVVEKENEFAKLVSWTHPAWTASIPGASWIWGDDPVADPVGETVQTFEKSFDWYGGVANATLQIAADNSYEFNLDGDVDGDAAENNHALETQDSYDVTSSIDEGTNLLAIAVTNWEQKGGTTESNPAGLLYKLTITGSDPSCEPVEEIPGCTDPEAANYDENATYDNESCEYPSSSSGGGGGRRHGSTSNEDPVPEVLGETTSVMPLGAADTGAGGTSTDATLPIALALVGMIASYALIRATRNG